MSRKHPRWGQNFLVDTAVARQIVDEAQIDGSNVVEIGPGRGALTELMAPRVENLVCLEIDPELAAANDRKFADHPNVRTLRTDALAYDWSAQEGSGFRLVSNLPYDAGTAILLDLLLRARQLESLTIMLQREVAERVAAKPGNKRWARLGVLVNMFADVEASIVVPPQAFKPAPKVYSQVLHLKPLAKPRYEIGSRAALSMVLASAFAGRRKMLRNNLGKFLAARYDEAIAQQMFAAAGIAETDRPEVVGLESWAAISRDLVARDGDREPSKPKVDA